jgi:uncharacterized membrane protein
MKKWLKEYKWNVVCSMVLTMLPSLVGLLIWNQLPDIMTSHWGADGVADGTAPKAFMVFGLPAILAALDILCILATSLDKKQAGQSKKAMGIIFWIMPVLSTGILSSVYAVALGRAMDILVLIPLLMGVLFVVIGNIMPKVKQNASLGVKIYWTLANEENWNKTHRFAGKVWVIGGILVMLSALLPAKWMIAVTLPALFLLAIAPMAYSYCIYRRHKAAGMDYSAPPASKGERIAKRGSIVGILAVLVLVAVLMFTGSITYTFTDSALQIEATYHDDAVVAYGQIDSVELREDFGIGYRAMGYSSAKLSLGVFQNDEFDTYTLYAYTSCDSMILVRSGDKWLAFNAQTEAETQQLYQILLSKIG